MTYGVRECSEPLCGWPFLGELVDEINTQIPRDARHLRPQPAGPDFKRSRMGERESGRRLPKPGASSDMDQLGIGGEEKDEEEKPLRNQMRIGMST